MYEECGNTTEHCSCWDCSNYTRIYREWEESGGTQKWRYDGRCGSKYPLPDGTPGQCDPEGDKPCCGGSGYCGSEKRYCSCKDCVNYLVKRWRNDGKCGENYTLSDGAAAQCNPDGEYSCCGLDGECGNSPEHCYCFNCVDYRPKKWRNDGRCGKDFPLPDGTPGQCDPEGWKPCCGRDGRCGAGLFHCLCNDCVSYVRKRWRSDSMCGGPYSSYYNTAPDGAPAECNRFGEHPYCKYKKDKCVKECAGDDCIDYRIPPRYIENKTCTCNNDTSESNSDTTRFGHRNYELNRFRCDNDRCINYNQLCNRVDDCGDLSDELDCPNHMICNYTKSANPKFVHVSKICDGYIDCFDMSDECNDSCGREILGSWVLKITCGFVGILALVLNCASLFHGLSSTIHDCPTEKMMLTKVLMSLIGSGDFLIGVYLIILSIYDSLVYGSSYCQHQPEWLTGTPCMLLGVISTVGSQLSLFSMTTLSCIIMYGVVFQKMIIPSEVSRKSIVKAASLALTILTASLAIAITPLIPALEDYFVQGMYYGTDIWLLTGFPDKKLHRDRGNDFLKSYPHSYEYIKFSRSWSGLGKNVDNMFSHHGDLRRQPVHFYGNDGVCLFKYFIRRDNEIYLRTKSDGYDDPDKAKDIVVWTMLIVNLLCFVIITVCYISITWKTRKSTQESGQYDNPDRLRENEAMKNRIILIIVTDFLCWVPFIMISGMHNLKYIDASTWYRPFAMTVLPINSVMNPLLYDKILLAFIMRRIRLVGEFITVKRGTLLACVESTTQFQGTVRQIGLVREYVTVRAGNISVRAALNRLCWRREENAPPENDIPMEVINH